MCRMKYDKYYEARDIIEKFLVTDLIGPVEENETIDEDPYKYYSTAILCPQGSKNHVEEDGVNLDDIQDMYDESISLCNTYNPSSMAITTTIKSNIYKLYINVTAANYIPEEGVKKELRKKKDENGEYIKDEDGRDVRVEVKIPHRFWKRNPISESVIANIADMVGMKKYSICEGLELQVFVQKIFKDNSKLVSIALVNTNKNQTSLEINNKNSFFQCKFTCTGENNEEAFIEKKLQVSLNEDEEIKNLNMLYSHIKNYAVGHGCAVNWTAGETGATRIETSFIPEHELLQMKPAVNVDRKILSMKFLSEGSKEVVCSSLETLIKSYGKWIEEIKNNDLVEHKLFADKNILLCEEAKERLRDAVNLLRKDEIVFKSFKLTNKAMLNQRIKFLERENREIKYDEITWYPFQLAFILQEIASIVDVESPYRNIVDLLWFPTGGGKTEAYLGISAFTIFFRRLSNKSGFDGVTIIMRYTLRLLTIQQFERAAALICACEILRQEFKLPGDEIGIGLWVGGGLTPNSLKDAEEALTELKKGNEVNEGNPVQVLKCPWCGHELDERNYYISNNGMRIKCSNDKCQFGSSSSLPIYLVDEDIYNNAPTLIISTVDKFARMAWEPRVRKIFGLGTINKAPELIIQDELHLISGPLGTITGIYEVAIRKLCEENNIKAKVIASTATIRNAKSQILALYGSDYRQFPPQGINIRDSYFAVESVRNDRPSRKYVGIFAPTKSPSTILIRTYASILFASRYLKDLGYDDKIIDNYWTLVGYFNSLRELGGALIQVLDDVQDRYKFLYTTKYKNVINDFTHTKRQDHYDELTSRKRNSEISEIIQKKLKVAYPSMDAYDFVLASNMISVGVDIGRLGVMTVTGQPKTTAEYIQATSRVGRENPGLVITLYNPSQSRDRSHYEQFKTFHSALYKYVEATSVTPFSERARDKALHGILISLCRQLIVDLSNNESAENIDSLYTKAIEIKNYILEEARVIDEKEIDNISVELNEILECWRDYADSGLVYQKVRNNSTYPLLKSNEDESGVYTTLNAMRNVEGQSNLYLEEE